MAYKWDAAEYARSSSGQQVWARELIEKLHLQGNESVLDIGCGDGKVTAELASRLPAGSVLGIDNSPEMVALAHVSYPPTDYTNLDIQIADAADLPYEDRFEAIFSNAVLHWVLDHKPVLQGIFRSLKPGGKALLQMGGQGNASEVVEAMDAVRSKPDWEPFFQDFEFPYGFYGAGEYCQWLCEVGLSCNRVELIPKDLIHPDRTAFEGWLRTTWLPYTQKIPQDRRQEFLDEVVDCYLALHPASPDGAVQVHMVRLEVETKKE